MCFNGIYPSLPQFFLLCLLSHSGKKCHHFSRSVVSVQRKSKNNAKKPKPKQNKRPQPMGVVFQSSVRYLPSPNLTFLFSKTGRITYLPEGVKRVQ